MVRAVIFMAAAGAVLTAGAVSSGCTDARCDETCPSAGHTSTTGSSGGSGGATTSQGGGITLLDRGEPCRTGRECASAFCADGVCCETACDSVCTSCNLRGDEGTCASDPEGTDPAGECAGTVTCDGAGACLYADHLWSQRFGASGSDRLNDLAIDSQGNVVIVGSFVGAVSFGGATLTSDSGSTDIVVAKYDAAGNHIWSKSFGDEEANQAAFAVAIDGNDDIILGGHFVGALVVGGATWVNTDADPDLYVVKLSPTGEHIWSKAFPVAGSGSSSGSSLYDLAVDGAGNVVFTGDVTHDVDFGGGTLVATEFGDAYIAKLTAAGVHVWSKVFTGPASQVGWSVATLPTNDIVLAGYFGGSIDLGGGMMTPVGVVDIFLARYAATGSHTWSARFGADAALPWSLAASSQGIAMAGMFTTSIDFGAGDMMAAGERDAFVAFFSNTGVHQWSKRFGSTLRDVASNVALDTDGRVVVTGYTVGSIDLGGGSLVSSGDEDVFVGKLDPSGAHIWSRLFGTPGAQLPEGLAIGAGDAVIIGGAFQGSWTLGGGNLTSAGSDDLFLAALGP